MRRGRGRQKARESAVSRGIGWSSTGTAETEEGNIPEASYYQTNTASNAQALSMIVKRL